jgi:hypothetical protein
MTIRTPLQWVFTTARKDVERQAWNLMTGGKRPKDIEAEIAKVKKRW